MKLQIKSIFGSTLFEYECEGITIKNTVEEAVKRYANLSSADLSSANLDKRYISVTRIGSRKGMTTYCFEDDIIWCGCFTGNLAEFEAKVNETHKDNAQFLKEYTGFINYLKSLK